MRKRSGLLRARAQSREDCLLGDLLTGAAPRVLNDALLRAAGLERHSREPLRPLLSARPGAIAALARAIVDFQVAVTGTRGFENAQVTAGGVATDGFDPLTPSKPPVPRACTQREKCWTWTAHAEAST